MQKKHICIYAKARGFFTVMILEKLESGPKTGHNL